MDICEDILLLELVIGRECIKHTEAVVLMVRSVYRDKVSIKFNKRQENEIKYKIAKFYLKFFFDLLHCRSSLPEGLYHHLREKIEELIHYRLGDIYLEDVLDSNESLFLWPYFEITEELNLKANDADLESRKSICRRLAESFGVPADHIEYFVGEIHRTIFNSAAAGSIVVLDNAYRMFGPNSGYRNFYDAWESKSDKETLVVGNIPLNGGSVTEVADDPFSLCGQNLNKINFELKFLYLIFFILLSMVGFFMISLVSDKIVTDVQVRNILPVLGCVSGIITNIWLAVWALRYAKVDANLKSLLINNRYVLYLRQSEIDEHPPSTCFEGTIVSALSKIAPVVSVGNHSLLHALIHPSGALRLEFPTASWESKIVKAIRHAELCFFVISPRRGYDNKWDNVDQAWKEIESIVELVRPGRVLFFFPNNSGDFPLLLLHPKGDRYYGVSNLLNEVRRFIEVDTALRLPRYMGIHEFLWWAPDGRFLKLKRECGSFMFRLKSELQPIYESFGKTTKPNRIFQALSILTVAVGAAAFFVDGVESVLDVAAISYTYIFLATLVVVDLLISLRERSYWFNYHNTIRPRGLHLYGLDKVFPGKTHPELPN